MFVFFNHTATTEIYTLSLHAALPICGQRDRRRTAGPAASGAARGAGGVGAAARPQHLGGVLAHRRRAAPHGALRSEEHTSELQSRQYLVCRLLLEKKKATSRTNSNLK